MVNQKHAKSNQKIHNSNLGELTGAICLPEDFFWDSNYSWFENVIYFFDSIINSDSYYKANTGYSIKAFYCFDLRDFINSCEYGNCISS